MTKYISEKELPPTFSPYEVYHYADSMLKHLLKYTLKTIEKTHLYSTQSVYYTDVNIDHRNHNGDGVVVTGLNSADAAAKKINYAEDLNIDDRINKFRNRIKNEDVYRIPLRYFTDFLTERDYRIKLFLETDMRRFFESKKLYVTGTAMPSPDVQIIFTKAPYIQYEQILVDKNFQQYLETIMVSKKNLRMGTQKTPQQKIYETNVGQDSIDVELLAANRQFDCPEISLVHNKSDKCTTIYDSYNCQMVAQEIKPLKLTNFTEVCSLTNEKNMTLIT